MCAGWLHGACANCGAQTEVARYAHALAGARLAADASPWNVRPSVRPSAQIFRKLAAAANIAR